MKKCPFCKAEIEENARFCLYCMTSLEEKQEIAIPKEKNKRWLVVLVAVLVFVIVVFSICLALRKDSPNNTSNGASSESQTLLENDSNTSTNDTNTIIDDSAQDNDLIAGSQSALSGENGVNQNSPQSNTPANNTNANNNPSANPITGPTNSQNTTTESTGSVIPTTGNGGSTTPSDEQENINNTPSTPTPDTSVTVATYVYRDAKYGDDFSVSADLDDCVVIIGVSTVSSNGEYIIPETLGGKKVVAIMGLAFSDANIKDTVKKVVVPASVKTIWGNAFANCYNLTDIYFRGQSIYVEENAFAAKTNRTGTLTIHCSYNCSDRNLRYYRNSASNYNALYEEWDG